MVSNTNMVLHGLVYRINDLGFFQGVGCNRPSSYEKGLLSCKRIFYIPMQYKPKLPPQTQEGLDDCMMLPHLEMPKITAASAIYSVLA